MAQGAAVLAVLLSFGPEISIQRALDLYQTIRKERAEKIKHSASATRQALHLPDGPEQQERDKRMWAEHVRWSTAQGHALATNKMDGKTSKDLWVTPEWQRYMFGVDIMAEAVAAANKEIGREE